MYCFNYRPETQSSVKGRKESDKRIRITKENVKPILISYVRAEAAQYALDLKQELVKQGFNVYLVLISFYFFFLGVGGGEVIIILFLKNYQCLSEKIVK